MSRQHFLLLAFGTLIVMGGLGFVLTPLARDINFWVFLKGQTPVPQQLLAGLFAGFLGGVLAWHIIKLPFLSSTRNFFTKLIGDLQLNTVQIIFVSVCAGIGEELLFRGAIQPIAGIFITSLVFVALHGYLNPFNLRISVYGIFMTFFIFFLGYITERLGILSSMMAHTVIDIYLLQKLSR